MNLKMFVNSLDGKEKNELFDILKEEIKNDPATETIFSWFNRMKQEKRLSARTMNLFKNNLDKIGEYLLSEFDKYDFMKIRNAGEKSWLEFETFRHF